MKNLNEKMWDEFPLDEIFLVGAGKRLETRNKVTGTRPFIGATENGNGVTGFVGNDNASKDNNVLGVNYNGAPCIAFYHPYECIFTDDVKRLHLRNYIDGENILLSFAPIFSKQREKYSYGYKFKEQRMLRQKLMLPVNNVGEPDYEYMEQYVIDKKAAMLARYRKFMERRITRLNHKDIPALNEKAWGKFSAFGKDALFEITTTNSGIDAIRLIQDGTERIPYVTRTDSNNGIARFVSDTNMEFGYDNARSITVGLDTQTAFWQSYDFVTGQNIQVIKSSCMNEYIAQFVIPLFKKQMDAKFNWGGNGATLKRMKTLEIMLPVDDFGKPDYKYMEQYTKNLMFRKYRQYLDFKY